MEHFRFVRRAFIRSVKTHNYIHILTMCFSLKIDSRDREIDRLQRIQDNDRVGDLLKLEAKLKSNEKIMAHQNAQVNRERRFCS